MPFRMLSRVGPGTIYYMGLDAPTERGPFGASGRLKSIVKHVILGLDKRRGCANNDWTNHNDLYVFSQGVAFWESQ